MRTYSDLLNKIVGLNTLKEQIKLLEEIVSQVSSDERLLDYDIWVEDARKILLDLQDGINIKEHPKYR